MGGLRRRSPRPATPTLHPRARRAARPFFLFFSWGRRTTRTRPRRQQYRDCTARADQAPPNVPEAGRPRPRRDLAGYYAHCTALDDCLGDRAGAPRRASRTTRSWSSPPTTATCSAPTAVRTSSSPGTNPSSSRSSCAGRPGWARARQLDTADHPGGHHADAAGLVRGCRFPSASRGWTTAATSAAAGPLRRAALDQCVAPFGQWTREIGGQEYRGIRTLRHTYVRDLRGPWLLFDNDADPFQMDNLASRPEPRTAGPARRRASRQAPRSRRRVPAGRATTSRWGYHVDATGTVRYTP